MKGTNTMNTNKNPILPVGKWFAAGAYQVSGATLAKMHREGKALRRIAPPKMCRTWDWYILPETNKEQNR